MNSVMWCDSTGKQRRFVAINTGDTAVDDVIATAETLHKTGVAQWVIYFGDKGTPMKQWGISPEQAKVIAGIYKPVNQVGREHENAAGLHALHKTAWRQSNQRSDGRL